MPQYPSLKLKAQAKLQDPNFKTRLRVLASERRLFFGGRPMALRNESGSLQRVPNRFVGACCLKFPLSFVLSIWNFAPA